MNIFGTDMRLSVHIDNKMKGILIIGEGSTQGLDDTTLAAEAKYLTDFYIIREKIFVKAAL